MAGISQGRSVSTIAGEGYSWDSVSLDAPGVSLGGGFSPQDLFFYGEQGAWYDPSDLSTMFQDRTGTTPVTADGQTVGLILDKSKGLVLGSESVTNGTFNTDTSGWTNLLDANLTVTSGVLRIETTSVSTNSGIRQNTTLPLAVGRWIKLSIDIVELGAGAQCSVSVTNGGATAVLGSYIVTPGNKVFYGFSSGVAGSGNFVIDVVVRRNYGNANIGDWIKVDNISIKELPGNHAVAPSDAARPLYKTDGTYSWLQFDGVDDSLSTAAIDFTGTDKMSVFSGVTSNNSTTCFLLELSSDYNSNPGSFYVARGTEGPSTMSISYRGSLTGWGSYFTVSDGVKLVGRFVGSISDDLVRSYKNGVSGTIPPVELGSGTLGNYPLYIASRASSSFFFNGNIYSLIVRGVLSTTDEITNTETWVNSKTGAY